jgi:hypothetical protein
MGQNEAHGRRDLHLGMPYALSGWFGRRSAGACAVPLGMLICINDASGEAN